MTIVLASQSPRRREFFRLLSLDFVVDAADIDETNGGNAAPAEAVRRLSEAKARAVSARHPHALVVGADTIVALEGDILGKPGDEADALRMLRALRGRTHAVLSSVTVIHPSGEEATECAETTVRMRHYTEAELRSYVNSGDPMDKAGAYAIQNSTFHPVSEIAGCYASVMGLPLCHLARAFWRVEEALSAPVPELCRAETGYLCAIYPGIWPGLPSR
jgi:septum formation protein